MTPIYPPDLFALRAAEGWIELGNPAEALLELSVVTAANEDHPAILETGWSACAASGDWEVAFPWAEKLVRLYPELAAGWMHRAYATRRMRGGGLAAALAALRPAAELFPTEPMVAFNLACYLAQSGEEEEAWQWYREAVRRGDEESVRAAALVDDDLRPLWPRIRG